MVEFIQVVEEKMKKVIEILKEEFVMVRVGRVNFYILDKVMVDYYGVLIFIFQVVSIIVFEVRMIVIQLWEVRMFKEIEKVI